ncbi:MAG: flagellar motor switch protein FliG [Gammaproteobacteria bacterium]|nr:MAG: flagellar motor switch protein FliG [Gammaproteobacteria bacterium]
MTDVENLSGAERAAIFLMSLTEEEAANIMKHMAVSEVQKLGAAMARLRRVTREQADRVLGTFTASIESEAPLVGRSPQSLKRLLATTLGEERAHSLLDRLIDDEPRGLDSLQLMDPKEIAEVIHREHPQVIAIVLAGLEPKKSAQVIAELPRRMASDVICRIARMGEVPQSAIEELDEVMQQRFSQTGGFKVTEMGGVRSAAEILNTVDKELGQKIIGELDEQEPELSQEIQDNMFIFENLLDIDDRGIQAIVREVTSDMLVLALKGAEPELQEKIFSNMSKRAAELLRDDLEAKGPVRLSEVEEAQKQIVQIVRKLADDGTIMIGGGGDDFV